MWPGASVRQAAVVVLREVAYLPGLTMRRIADIHPGTAKTDARDSYVLADAARTMPHLLRGIDTGEATRAELSMLLGYDDDLAGDATRLSNRLRGLLTGIHPHLERVLGPRLSHPAVLDLLAAHGSPAAALGTDGLVAVLAPKAPQMPTLSPRS